MMKKFLFLITVSVLAGMLGAYVTTASAQQACSPGYSWDTIKNCCVSPTESQCRALDGSTYCSVLDDEGSIYNANGDPIESCAGKNARCKSYTPGKAQCVPNGPCDPNASMTNCINSTTVTNSCGKVETCPSNQKCAQRQGCVDKDQKEIWLCFTPNPVTNKSYGRYSTSNGFNEICPGSCNPDGNGDGNGGDAICVPGVCDAVLAAQRSCNGWGNIVNGCGELIDECSARNEACHADANQTCSCRPKPPVVDQCNNIAGVQENVPSGMTRDGAGNCTAPNPCAGTVLTTSTDYVGPDAPLDVNCQIGGQPGEVWTKARFWDHGKQQWYDKEKFIGKGQQRFTAMDDYYASMKSNEANQISCRLNQGQVCAQKDVHVYRTTCDTRGFTATAYHATIGQEIEFDCHGGAGMGAFMWMYEVSMDEPIWEKRLSMGPEKFIAGYKSLNDAGVGPFAGWRFVPNTDWNWGFWTNDANKYKLWWGGYCGVNGESCADPKYGAYDINETGGTMKWKPNKKGMFWAQCFPKNHNGGAYPIGQDIDSCGARFVIVDDLPGTDVSVVKAANKPTFPNSTGEVVYWGIVYKNNGSNPAEKVVITDTLPVGLTYDDVLSNTPTGIFNSIKRLPNNQIQWILKDPLAAGATNTITFKSKYVGGKPNDVALTNMVTISTFTPGDLGSNNGWTAEVTPVSAPATPVSCNDVVISTNPTSTGTRIDYSCSHSGAMVAQFKLMSGNTTITTVNGFAGSVFATPGTYTGVCMLDGSISYKVITYVPATTVVCAYRQHKINESDKCAVKSALDPVAINPLNLNNLILMPTPIVYCTAVQESDNANYKCIDAVAGSKILTQDPNACTESIVVSSVGSLGDRIWFDSDKDGIQDPGEIGVAGSKVILYRCDMSYVASGFTSSTGYYRFDGLGSGEYKIIFDLPTGYNKFTSKNATGSILTGAKDSNVGGTNGNTDCIPLAAGESNMTIDAGVYTESSCCGGNNMCGDGKLDPKGEDNIAGTSDDEQCDDGNVVDGDKCSRTCKIETTSCTRCGGGGSNTIKKIVKNPKGGYVDPPDVMIGEYLPYRWSFDRADNTEFVDDCNQPYQSATTYVLNQRDQYGAVCEFYLVDAAGIKSKPIQHYCDERRNLTGWRLFDTYLNGVIGSNGINSIKNNYLGSSGASFISSGNWITNSNRQFTNFGEYKLVWDKTTYYTCNAKFKTEVTWEDTDGDGTNDTMSTGTVFDGYERSSLQVSDVDVDMRLTVTKPYMTQKNGLSVSSGDKEIIDNILKMGIGKVVPQGSTTTTVLSDYKGSQNLSYLVKQFVLKYNGLARSVSSPSWLFAGNARKITSAEIYVLGDNPIISATNSLKNATLIVPEGDITIRGNLDATVMVLAPQGSIVLDVPNPDTANQPNTQLIRGIYIAQSIKSVSMTNSDLSKAWRFGGLLKIDGLIVNLANSVADPITALKNMRRSTLNGFFITNVDYLTLIKDGAALQISTNPSLRTNLPPGANELMKELQAFK